MDEDKNKQAGRGLQDLLHNKQRLQSLRTYQGDTAEAIKNLNESVASIAIKEKERQEEQAPPKPKGSAPISFMKIITGLVLIVGSVLILLFATQAIQKEDPEIKPLEIRLITYNNKINVEEISKNNIESALNSISENGTTILNLIGKDGKEISSTKELLNILQINPPSIFLRNISMDYVVGSHKISEQKTHFIIFKIGEFGAVFSGMLEWESAILNDLSFLKESGSKKMSTSTEKYIWKDLIIKNKDVRALVQENDYELAKITYTFLDKNTILVTSDIEGVSNLVNLYISRAVAR
ncbi:MAG: hypothetical protein AAB392_03025 [Patescibacteria group bacterium]